MTKFKRELTKAKRSYWKKFIENAKLSTPFGENCKFMRGLVNYKVTLGAIKSPSGFQTAIAEKVIKELISHYFMDYDTVRIRQSTGA